MSEKTCLITGGTSGLGKATALALAELGYRVIVLGRDAKKLEKTRREIVSKTGNQAIEACRCDLSLLADVRSAAETLRGAYERLDVLVNNAGARFARYGLTREGIELTLATNHLGPFVLTLSLIGLLEKAGEARIVNVSSGTHRAAKGVIKNVKAASGYDGRRQYAESKLANILFTRALSAKLSDTGITVNSVDPGGVATNFARNNGLLHWLKHRLYYLGKGELLSPARGAETIVFLASSDEVRGVTGKHFYNCKAVASSERSRDKPLQEDLWNLSARLSSIDFQVADHER